MANEMNLKGRLPNTSNPGSEVELNLSPDEVAEFKKCLEKEGGKLTLKLQKIDSVDAEGVVASYTVVDQELIPSLQVSQDFRWLDSSWYQAGSSSEDLRNASLNPPTQLFDDELSRSVKVELQRIADAPNSIQRTNKSTKKNKLKPRCGEPRGLATPVVHTVK
eukprot:TRINITY_DN64840_c0_g1_i12.p2 TRINITY_DN64840_c0_g1~~TRINITY_DN64840_c0_g1_i12.p2  ORF type:complete len:163 (-),score=20.51 TRINITY_DN64840_c0_g1_i12:14-502(-)